MSICSVIVIFIGIFVKQISIKNWARTIQAIRSENFKLCVFPAAVAGHS